jgi:hypothetical protein
LIRRLRLQRIQDGVECREIAVMSAMSAMVRLMVASSRYEQTTSVSDTMVSRA